MRLLNRYVLREWLISFFGTYIILAALLLLEDVYKNFFDFLKVGANFWELVTYSISLIVSITPSIMPLVVFVSALFALGQLHRKNEITAMRSMGISLLEIGKPLLVCGLIIVGVNLFLEAFVAPAAGDYVDNFRLQCSAKRGSNTLIRKLGFFNKKDNRSWFIGSMSKLTHKVNDVVVSNYDAEGFETERIFSETGQFIDGHWKFYNGNVILFDKNGKFPDKIETFSEKNFENFSERPKVFCASTKKIKYLSLRDVITLLKYSDGSADFMAIHTKFHKIFSNSMSCFLVLMLAIPCAVIGVRESPLVGVSRALGVLLVFAIMSAICSVLGNNGVLHAFVAAWAVPIIMIFPIVKIFQKA